MYSRAMSNCIDLYADVVRPFLGLTRDQAIECVGESDGRNGPLSTQKVSNYYSAQFSTGVSPPFGRDWLNADVSYLLPWVVRKLLRHVTGHEVLARLADFVPTAKSLHRQPGVILASPLLGRYVNVDADLAAALPPLMWPYWFDDTIELYSGQQLIGTGQRFQWFGEAGSSSVAPEQAPFGAPLFAFQLWAPAIPQGDGIPAFRAVGPSPERPATDVIIRDLDIKVSLTSSYHPPEDDPDVVEQVLADSGQHRIAIDFGNAAYSTVSRVWMQGFETSIRLGVGDGCIGNWVESCQIRCPIDLRDRTEDCSLWCCRFQLSDNNPRTTLVGANNQLWFGVVEGKWARDASGDEPTSVHEIEVGGAGCGVFGVHTEGELDPQDKAPSGIGFQQTRDDRYSVVRVLEGAKASHVSLGHFTLEGFPITVERDAALTLIRHHTDADVAIQNILNAGLTNLLRATTFESAGANDPGWPWVNPAGADVGFDRVPVPRRALEKSLQVNFQGMGTAPQVVLTQRIVPGDSETMPSVADRTFSVGCWVNAHAFQAVSLELLEVLPDGGIGRRQLSNFCRGGDVWRYLSATLHTSAEAVALDVNVCGKPGEPFYLSEPILVQGVFVPPYHPGPVTEVSAEAFGRFSPLSSTDSVMLQRVGPIPRLKVTQSAASGDNHVPTIDRGDSVSPPAAAAAPLDSTVLDEAAMLLDAVVVVGSLASGECIRCWVAIHPPYGKSRLLPAAGELISADCCDAKSPAGPARRRLALGTSAMAVAEGTTVELYACAVKHDATGAEVPIEVPHSRDLAACIRLRRGV